MALCTRCYYRKWTSQTIHGFKHYDYCTWEPPERKIEYSNITGERITKRGTSFDKNINGDCVYWRRAPSFRGYELAIAVWVGFCVFMAILIIGTLIGR